MEQGPRGTLVGTDYNGNRYFENNDSGYSAYLWMQRTHREHGCTQHPCRCARWRLPLLLHKLMLLCSWLCLVPLSAAIYSYIVAAMRQQLTVASPLPWFDQPASGG
jgi:hypothetical protein